MWRRWRRRRRWWRRWGGREELPPQRDIGRSLSGVTSAGGHHRHHHLEGCGSGAPRLMTWATASRDGGWSVVLPPFLLRPCLRSSSLVSISLVAPSCCRPLRGAIPVRFLWPSTVSAAAVWCDREMDRCSRRRRRVAGKEMANGDMQRTKRVSIAGPETCERRGNGRYRYGSTIHNSFTTDVHVIRTPF